MAFLPSTQDETQTQNQGANSQVTPVPTIPTLQGTSGPSASTGSGTQAGTTNTASPGAAPSAPWQNITTYLNANAPNANQVAQSIAGNLTNQYNTANQAITDTGTNFTNQVNGANIAEDPNMLQSASSNPGQFVQDPNNVTAFQKQYNASYGGPSSFSGTSDFSNLQNQVLQAQNQAALANQGTSGIQTLLQQTETNPSVGVNNLDNLLLQEDPTNFQTIQNAAAPFSNLTAALGSQQTSLDQLAQQAAQGTAQTAQDYQNAFVGPKGVIPTFQNNFNQEMQTASGQATGYNQQLSDIIAALGSGKSLQNTYPNFVESNVDPSGTLEALNPYGQSTGVFQNMLAEGLPGVAPGTLGTYFTADPQVAQPGAQNVMTPEEFQNANAINQLVGQNAINVPQSLGPQFKAPTQYGSFDSQGALNGLYQALQGDQSMLPQMSPDQQSSWLADIQQLASWLGQPSTNYPNPTPIAPTPPPAPGTGPGLGAGGGPPYLQPPNAPPSGTTNPGGGRHFF